MLLLPVVGAWPLFCCQSAALLVNSSVRKKNQQQLQVLEARFAFFTASSSLEQSTSIEVQSTKCKALVFPTATISTVVLGSVHSDDVDKCSVHSHSAHCALHSHAEKCFSQCAVAACSLNFKLSSVLGARLLTFSLNFRLNPASCFQAGRNKKGLHACNTVVFINCSEF